MQGLSLALMGYDFEENLLCSLFISFISLLYSYIKRENVIFVYKVDAFIVDVPFLKVFNSRNTNWSYCTCSYWYFMYILF